MTSRTGCDPAKKNVLLSLLIIEDTKTPCDISDLDKTIGKVKFFILNSHIFGLFAKAAFAVAFIFTCIKLTPEILQHLPMTTLSLELILGISGVTCLIILAIEVIRLSKQLKFEATLLFTIKQGKEWWTPITDNIILGAIPLDGHLARLTVDFEVDAVLTMLESFELKKSLVKPISKEDWGDTVVHKHIEACDFIGVPPAQLHEGVEFLKERIDEGQRVYVHCKAGRGRSASVVLAYLLKHGTGDRTFDSFEEAHDHLKALRPQISINANQRATIEAYYDQHCT